MKKLLSAFLALTVMISMLATMAFTVSAATTVFVDDDVEYDSTKVPFVTNVAPSGVVGEVTPEDGVPFLTTGAGQTVSDLQYDTGWNLHKAKEDTSGTIDAYYVRNGDKNYVSAIRRSAATAYLYKKFAYDFSNNEKYLVMEFDAKFYGGCEIYVRDSDNPHSGNLTGRIKLYATSTNDYLELRPYIDGTATTVAKIGRDEWYHYKIIANFETKKITYHITNMDGSAIVDADYPDKAKYIDGTTESNFITAGATKVKVLAATTTTNGGMMSFDNVSVYSSDTLEQPITAPTISNAAVNGQTVTATVTSPTAITNAVVLAGVYDANGVLVGLGKNESVSVNANGSADLSIEINSEVPADGTVKLFLWNGLTNIMPLANVATATAQ